MALSNWAKVACSVGRQIRLKQVCARGREPPKFAAMVKRGSNSEKPPGGRWELPVVN